MNDRERQEQLGRLVGELCAAKGSNWRRLFPEIHLIFAEASPSFLQANASLHASLLENERLLQHEALVTAQILEYEELIKELEAKTKDDVDPIDENG
jgi:hypothetical protein